MKKLLVVSHACVTPINQSFYADVEAITGWQISLVVPQIWNTEYKAAVTTDRWDGFAGAIHKIPVWRPGNIPLHLYQSTMVTLLKRESPDAIYVHHEPYGLATFQMYLANRMSTNRPIGFYAAQNISKQYPPPFRWFEQYVFAQSSFAFPVTDGALEVLRAKGYSGPAEVLPLPINTTLYRPRRDWAAAKRLEMGITTDEFVIGYLGRLVEEKGLRSLFLALAQLERSQRWRCVLVGNGAFESELRNLAQELDITDRVIFVGFVPHEEAPGWLTLFDLFVLPSESRSHWKEQFGRVIVEANACGTPVLGSESGEIGHVLRKTGGGRTIPERNPAALAQVLCELMQHPPLLNAMAEAGAKASIELYDQRNVASAFAAAISHACDSVV